MIESKVFAPLGTKTISHIYNGYNYYIAIESNQQKL